MNPTYLLNIYYHKGILLETMAFKPNAKDIRNIAFEQIYENYHWGKYGEFRVIIDLNDGYINATKLCNQAMTKGGKPKEYYEYTKTKESKAIKEDVSLEHGIPCSSLEREINGRYKDNEIIKGTYVHPEMISNIAGWASNEFARKIRKIINEYYTKQAIEEKDKIIMEQSRKLGEKDEMLVEKDKKILTLEEKMDLMMKKMDDQTLEMQKQALEMKAQNEITHQKLDISQENLEEIKEKLDVSEEKLNEAKEDVDKISKKLGVAVEDRVPKDPVLRRNELFALYRNNTNGRYKAVRCQWANYKASIAVCKKGGHTDLVYEAENPNPVNVLNRLRIQFNINPIASIQKTFYIVLAAGSIEQDLIDLVDNIIAEKSNV